MTSAAARWAAVWLAAIAPLPAEGTRAAVTGVVGNGAGPVEAAEVSVLSLPANEILTVRTGPDGRFRIDLAAGGYEVYVRAPGFAVASSSGIAQDGETIRWNPILQREEPARTSVAQPRREAVPSLGDRGPNAARRGGEVRPPRLMSSVPPVYPPEARDAGVQGRVQLRLVVQRNGAPARIQEVTSPSPLLTAAAKECVARWRYFPARLDGMPVESTADAEVWFEISQTPAAGR